MCRLFGMVARQSAAVAPWLLDAPIPFLRQATVDPKELQGDGWGIAWFPSPEEGPRLEKGAEGVHLPLERDHFIRVASGLRAPLVIAHLRKASNPLGLPREKLVALENTQPFLSDGTVFAHNGWIPLPRETLKYLGPRAGRVRGVNDSEVLQQLFLREIDLANDPVRAYTAAVEKLREVWEDQGRPPKGPHGGLNILFAPTVRDLWAFCYYSGEHGTCLSGLPRPYYEMSYRQDGDRVIVVSEPTDRELGRWRPIRSGEYLHVHLTQDRSQVLHGTVPGLPVLDEGAKGSPVTPVAVPAS
jgi:predicted glutamine amidotransferase